MRPMPPFTNFINQCQNNMQWPQVGKSGKKPEDLAYTYRYKLGRGASEHCGKMLNETEGMSQGEANYHFCKDSTTGKEIMSGERPHIDTEVLIHLYEFNHRKQCDGFLAKYNPWH
jgi:hypothetical protein